MPIQRITSGILANGAIVAADIADGSVTTSKLADANVTTSKLANTLSISGNFLANNVTANTNLIVPAGSNTAPSIFPSGDTNTGIFFPAADTIAFAEGGVESMRIDSNGCIGVATTTIATNFRQEMVGRAGNNAGPASSGTTQSTSAVMRIRPGGGFTAALDIGQGGGFGSWIQSTDTANLATTYPLLLNPVGGNLYIHCQSQPSSSVTGFGVTSIANGPQMYWGTSATDNKVVLSMNNPNGQVGYILTSGSSTTYSTSSDYRLKENIAPMTGALATIAQLKPCTYTWKVDGSAGQGFIAHELQAVVPDCVTGEKDAVEIYTDEEGVEQTKPVYQGVDTSFLVATLTAAIQELKAINDTQAQTISALEARIEALESQ